MEAPGPVLFYDGECGLCVRCVRFLLRMDRLGRLRFAPLQGETAQRFLRERGLSTEDFSTAIFVENWDRRSVVAPLFATDALLAALKTAGSAGRMVAWARVFPPSWRNTVYGWIARRRQCFFGPWQGRPLGAGAEAERFLP